MLPYHPLDTAEDIRDLIVKMARSPNSTEYIESQLALLYARLAELTA